MPFEFSAVLEESKSIQADEFLQLTKNAAKVICQNQNGKLACIEPSGAAVVIGDLHGDIKSLQTIFEKSQFANRLNHNKATLVFLGDYGDRGAKSVELYYLLMRLKLSYPEQVILLRGNHEAPADLMASPHDLPYYFQRKFKQDGGKVYEATRGLFGCLCNAAYVQGRYLMVHGGLPKNLQTLQTLSQADQTHPAKAVLEELLWSDPAENLHGTQPSPRGAGNLFGSDVTRQVLMQLNVKILIRGHESPNEGYKISHNNQVLTLFSRKGPPYFNSKAAYLDVPLTERFASARELLPFIHQF
ncbi:MAG: serine/threonine protein phosphatase [Candidatus Bathyarchaeota archaeon]|nr:serine/threonine protein phosphatase [Candidatus Bathyarchaeota archaeon]